MHRSNVCLFVVVAFTFAVVSPRAGGDEPGDLGKGLVAHWPLEGDADDKSGHALHAAAHGLDFQAVGRDGRMGTAASFDGRQAWLEVPSNRHLQLGFEPFSIAAWVDTDDHGRDLIGDIMSCYDEESRRGYHLAIKTNCGVTFTHANDRQLQFAIDNDRQADSWTDRGRPGDAVLAFALCVHDGHLYAGICDPGRDRRGGVFRFEKPDQWIACGSPDQSNAVTALARHDGRLYAGTGKYRLGGSALQESENTQLGGRVFRLEGESQWIDCGQLPGVEAVGGLVEFQGRLYASSLYKPAGFFRYEGGDRWTDCGTPDGMRVEAMGIYNGHIYASCYDGGRVFRYDGQSWTDCGQLGDATENTQTYAFAVYQGKLHAGTWRSGRVYRFDDLHRWTDVGRLGEELEVMGMLVHNGRLIAGTLPSAEVYEFVGPASWRRLATLDATPDVRYRRAWTMAEFDGRLFCSTLPSGKVFSWEAGKCVQWNSRFPSGWHHVASVRSAGRLALYVDGTMVAQSDEFSGHDFDVSHQRPLFIGRGPNDLFCGRLSDVRLYNRALDASEIRKLATSGASSR